MSIVLIGTEPTRPSTIAVEDSAGKKWINLELWDEIRIQLFIGKLNKLDGEVIYSERLHPSLIEVIDPLLVKNFFPEKLGRKLPERVIEYREKIAQTRVIRYQEKINDNQKRKIRDKVRGSQNSYLNQLLREKNWQELYELTSTLTIQQCRQIKNRHNIIYEAIEGKTLGLSK